MVIVKALHFTRLPAAVREQGGFKSQIAGREGTGGQNNSTTHGGVNRRGFLKGTHMLTHSELDGGAIRTVITQCVSPKNCS